MVMWGASKLPPPDSCNTAITTFKGYRHASPMLGVCWACPDLALIANLHSHCRHCNIAMPINHDPNVDPCTFQLSCATTSMLIINVLGTC